MAANWQTIGHDSAVSTLTRSMASGRMAHAWLFAGPPRVGKMTLALDLARLVNCTTDDTESRPCAECRQCRRITNSLHADLRVISRGGGDGSTSRRTAISVEQIRELQRDAVLKPYEGRYRVFIIEDAENFTQEAANALLKMLEEPPADVIFALLASEVREKHRGRVGQAISHTHRSMSRTESPRCWKLCHRSAAYCPQSCPRCQTLELRPLSAALVQSEIESRFNLPSSRRDRNCPIVGAAGSAGRCKPPRSHRCSPVEANVWTRSNLRCQADLTTNSRMPKIRRQLSLAAATSYMKNCSSGSTGGAMFSSSARATTTSPSTYPGWTLLKSAASECTSAQGGRRYPCHSGGQPRCWRAM